MSARARAVFLDRDGVLNEALIREGRPYPPVSLDELRISANAPGLVARLRAAGFLVIGVTNQPDVARGMQTRETADALSQAVGRREQRGELRPDGTSHPRQGRAARSH